MVVTGKTVAINTETSWVIDGLEWSINIFNVTCRVKLYNLFTIYTVLKRKPGQLIFSPQDHDFVLFVQFYITIVTFKFT